MRVESKIYVKKSQDGSALFLKEKKEISERMITAANNEAPRRTGAMTTSPCGPARTPGSREKRICSGKDVKIWGQATAAGPLAHSLSDRDLARGLKIVEDIRSAVPEMKIAIEGHARWDWIVRASDAMTAPSTSHPHSN
jgi:hypothetical protein